MLWQCYRRVRLAFLFEMSPISMILMGNMLTYSAFSSIFLAYFEKIEAYFKDISDLFLDHKILSLCDQIRNMSSENTRSQ